MSPFATDKRDIQFTLFEYLKAEELCQIEKYSDFNRETFQMVLDQALKFTGDVLFPLNTVMDREGVKFDKGKVIVPRACHEAYNGFCEGGWVAPSGAPEYGGQGLPMLLNSALTEIQGSGCVTFLMAPGLTRATGHLIETHGTERMIKLYLEKLYTGQWGGTMCLTESGAGSAVGDLKTKAIRDGKRFRIEGEKIFITFGDHDLTENIIHLVLARIEGAPKGIKGVSLFLVPKVRVKEDGTLGEPNNVACSRIEEKMGIHGSPTCTMVFGDGGPCYAELIGEENQGIKYMFQMMNEARIGVALQGLSAASASYQQALAYARERIQGVDMKDMADPDAPRVPIISHPDVRRMLLGMKAYTEGMRAMIYFAALCADVARYGKDEQARQESMFLLDFLTPICKSYCSDSGFQVTCQGIQVLGGYGYTKEYPLEQYCRDSKIASIYEGTNGIQALDLLGRKVAGKGAAAFMTYMNRLNAWLDQHGSHPTLGEQVGKVAKARDALVQVVMTFQQKGADGDFYYPLLCATPFLEQTAQLVMSHLLTDMAVLAEKKLSELVPQAKAGDARAWNKLEKDNPEVRFYRGKIHSARFFVDTVLPHAQAIAETILSSNRSPLDVTF